MKDVRGLEIVKYCFKIAIEAILFEPLRWCVMQLQCTYSLGFFSNITLLLVKKNLMNKPSKHRKLHIYSQVTNKRVGSNKRIGRLF